MDYGKLAYLKIEDLTKQIDNLKTQVETAPYNCLSVLNKRPYYFEKNFKIEDYTITAKKQTVLTLQYKILLSSVSSETFDFSIYINNVKVETFTDYIGSESKSFTFTIVAEGFTKGDNNVSAAIDFKNSGQYNLLCSEINAMGNNIYETVKTVNADVLEKRVGTLLAFSKPEDDYIYVLDQNFNYNILSTPFLSLKKSGKNYAITNMFYQNEAIYETSFYAYISAEKNLVINLLGIFSGGTILDSKVLDTNVSSVSASESLNPVGVSVAYVKNNAIYTSNISTNGSTLAFTAPKIFETIYGKVNKTIVFKDKNDRTNLYFSTNLGNSYLKIADLSKSGNDYAELFQDKAIGLGKCENIRFKPLNDKILIFIKFKGAVYERILENNKLSEPVLAAFCDELIPFKDQYITRKNNRLSILAE